MKHSLENLYKHVLAPARYVGGEFGSVNKDHDRVQLKWALAYPDLYEIGMSFTGLKILYHTLNQHDHILAERVFAPAKDMARYLKEHQLPLYSLESQKPINQFDLFGITLQTEGSFTSIPYLLDLAYIPVFQKDRSDSDPIVIGGGPVVFNPEPVADFFDCILIGDGEEAIIEISECLIKLKGSSRSERLNALAEIEGVYVPSLFEITYNGTKIAAITPLKEGYNGVSKRIVADIESAPFPERPIVPGIQIVHDRIGVEIQKGCTRGCRFCQAGITYRPVRQRSPERIKEIIREGVKHTGLSEAGLLSLSVGDYGCIEPLMGEIIQEHQGKHVSLSLPSLRIETLTDRMIAEAAKFRKSGFTLAPEAATNRMRRVINKGNQEEDLLHTVERIFEAGWDHLKLYFMIGLPFETTEDVAAIADLCKKCVLIAKQYCNRPKVEAAVNVFIPKAATPFQWASMIDEETYQERREALYQNKNNSFSLKMARYRDAIFESILARSDRRLSSVIYEVYQAGGYLEGWTENFDLNRWYEALKNGGFELSDLIGKRALDDILPYDHINPGVSKQFLRLEYQKSEAEIETPDCLTSGKCSHCGACDFKEVKNRAYTVEDAYPEMIPHFQTETATENNPSYQKQHRYLLSFTKGYPASYLSHLSTSSTIGRIFKRSDLPLTYSQGFNQRPLIGFYSPLALGVESNREYLEFFTFKPIDLQNSIQLLNSQSVTGLTFTELKEVSIKKSSELTYKWQGSRYLYQFSPVPKDIIAEYQADPEHKRYEITREKKKGRRIKIKKMSLHEYIKSITVTDSGVIIDVSVNESTTIHPLEIIKHLFQTDLKDPTFQRIIKLDTMIGLEA